MFPSTVDAAHSALVTDEGRDVARDGVNEVESSETWQDQEYGRALQIAEEVDTLNARLSHGGTPAQGTPPALQLQAQIDDAEHQLSMSLGLNHQRAYLQPRTVELCGTASVSDP